MAGFKQHISVSGGIGVATGLTATVGLGFTPVQGMLVGYLTTLGGMLPDLDSSSGRPIRELFGVTAALVPMAFADELRRLGGDMETVLLLAVVSYLSIRFGGAWLLSKLAVHRVMFHSVPAMMIAAEVVFLTYHSDSNTVRLLMAVGIALGFLSHLILDEIYAVQWNGLKLELNQFAGSAVKFFGKSFSANAFTWLTLAGLTWYSFGAAGIVDEPPLPTHDEIRQILHTVPAAETPEPGLFPGI